MSDSTPRSAVTLCVLLWAVEGEQAALVDYEDQVLRLLPEHGARVLHRVRHDGDPALPFEVHLLEFPSEDALDAYLGDPRRSALAPQRDGAIARTEVLRVDRV